MCAPVHRPAFQFSSTRACKSCLPPPDGPLSFVSSLLAGIVLGLTHRYLAWAQQAKGDVEKAINDLRQAVLL